jgi:hypothetical protein
MTTAVVVQNRSFTRHIPALGMKCDEREIPAPLAPTSPPDYWLGMGAFIGTAELLTADGNFEPGYEVHVLGTVALAVGDGRLIGIVAPDQATATAVWVAPSLGDIAVKAEGKTGLIRKRPERIEIRCDDWEILIGRVESLYIKTNMTQYGREASLLAALIEGDTR